MKNENYKKLREEGLSRIRKPWNVESLTVDDVKEILGNDYEKSSKEVLIATQICHLLAQNTDGNQKDKKVCKYALVTLCNIIALALITRAFNLFLVFR